MSRVEPPAGSEDVCCPGERQLPPSPFKHPPPTTLILPPPPLCLLHLRPSTHPSTYSTTPFYRDVPRDGQPRLTVESALQTRSPLCIVHINDTVLGIGERHRPLRQPLPSPLVSRYYHRCQLFHLLLPFLRFLHHLLLLLMLLVLALLLLPLHHILYPFATPYLDPRFSQVFSRVERTDRV